MNPKRLFNRRPVMGLAAVLMLAALLGVWGGSQVTAASGPTLLVQAPRRVPAGKEIRINLRIVNAQDVAGYELNALFDDSVAFNGLVQRRNDVSRQGRDVRPLIALIPGHGVAMGFYSCGGDCAAGGGQGGHRASGSLSLGTLSLLTREPGPVEIRFDQVKFVDSSGHPLSVQVPDSRIVVQVGSGGALRSAPTGSYVLSGVSGQTTAPASGSFDLTGDGRVNQADVSEAALAWSLARQFGGVCGNLANPAADVNRDGCIDIADVQTIAANSAPTVAVASTIAKVWTVDTTADAPDTNIGDGICAANVPTTGKCTLRAAIQEANANPGPDTIDFNIPGTGVQTIQLNGTALPTLSDLSGPTTIDGYSQPGSALNTSGLTDNAQIRIEIVGGGPGTGSGTTGYDGIPITSPNNVIRGLSLYNLRRAIWINGLSAHDNLIVGNFIGTNAAGTFGLPTRITFASGVYIDSGPANTQIGTPNVADRNVISGSAMNGVGTYFEFTDSAVIYNNIIGLNPSATAALPNRNQGVDINSDSSSNVIGGTGPGQRNVISGNARSGIEFSHSTLTSENKAIGNYIGTDVNGNGGGNPQQCASYYTQNGEWGVHIEDGVNNSLVANNVIGNSVLGGVKTEGYDTVNNIITVNRIGIGMDGNPIPNCLFGVQAAYNSTNQQIGPGNIIAFNQEGVQVTTPDADYNKITRNSIYGNTNYQNSTPGNGRGIDLDPLDPVDPNLNDPGDLDMGANQQLNFPVLQSATQYQVTGTACPDAIVPKPCTVEIFIADRGAGGYGQGKTFVGAGQPAADGSFSISITGAKVGDWLTSTATDAQGDTSEFGANIEVGSGSPVPTPTPTGTPSGSTTTFASDQFSRQLSGGWGVADVGGGYALEGQVRPNPDYNVNGSQGTMQSGSGGVWHGTYLPSVSATNADLTFRFATDKLETVGYQFAYFSMRRVATGTQYLGRIALTPAGGVMLQAAKSQTSDVNVTFLGSEVSVPGLNHTAGGYIRVHGQVTGTNPTTIRIRAWADGQAEPSTWQYTVTDSEPALQAPGAVGLRTYVSSSATALPVTFSFDDFAVTGPTTSNPTPTPQPTMVPSGTTTPPPTSTPAPTNTPTPTSTPGSGTTFASDSFTRNLTNGWGTADIGGAYSVTGTTSDYSVNGSFGLMSLGLNLNRSAYLNVSVRDLEGSFRVATDKASAGGGQIAYFVGRRVSAGNNYLARLRFPTDGTVRLVAAKEVAGSVTTLGGEVVVTGLSHSAGSWIRVRVQMTGANPTTIRMRAWPDGTAEPSTWQYAVTDSTTGLQTAGGVGLRAYLSGSATNAPVAFDYDDLLVTSPLAAAANSGTIARPSVDTASPQENEPLSLP